MNFHECIHKAQEGCVIMENEPCPICGNPKWRLTPDADSVAICPDCDYATDDPLDYHE